MRLGLSAAKWTVNFGFWGPRPETTVAMAQLAESLGYDSVWTAEASGTDALTPLAYLAGHTSRIRLGTAIMQMAGRSPTMTAMSAVTMDMLSGGRFVLGLGVSGPGVVEGWHSQPYGRPLERTREYVDIVNAVVARQGPLEHHGAYYDIPYKREDGTGEANPIKLMVRPRRPRIPIYLAAMGPANVRLAAELADGIIPSFWSPYREDVVLGHLADEWEAIGDERVTRGLPRRLEIAPLVSVAMGDDVGRCISQLKPVIAFWIGSMGLKGVNFYNRLVQRYGYAEEARRVHDLYTSGQRAAAASAVPDDLIDELCLCGPKERIADRLEAWKESSVTMMILHGVRREGMELLAELVL